MQLKNVNLFTETVGGKKKDNHAKEVKTAASFSPSSLSFLCLVQCNYDKTTKSSIHDFIVGIIVI